MTTGFRPGPDRPRIEPLSPDDPLARRMTIGSDRNDGRPLNIFLTLARNEALFKSFGKLGTHLLFEGLLPARQREIVILRIGAVSQSEYEFGQHTVIGRDAGLTAEEIDRLAAPGTAGWSPADAALLRLADELCADDVVSDATWQELATRWNDAELLELLVLAGFYRLVSGMLSSAGVPLEPATPGWPSAAPERRRAPRAEQS
jgi:alkylhydroperoxidase family enzyme